MRFKPPPPNSNIGWRIEFRTTDLQITDFENAAFTCFVVLITRAVLAGDLRTVMPITKVDENMANGNDTGISDQDMLVAVDQMDVMEELKRMKKKEKELKDLLDES